MKELTPVDAGTEHQHEYGPVEELPRDRAATDESVPGEASAADEPLVADEASVSGEPLVADEASAADEPPGPETAVEEAAPTGQPAEPATTDESNTISRELLARLERRLDEALRLVERRDDLLDRLHRENQELRKGELQTAMLPLLRDLMRLHDDLERIIELDQQSRDMALIRDALSDTLARNGITRFLPDESEPFDSARHATVSTQPTTHRSADRTICAVRRAGFQRDDGSIVRVADVTVWSYRAAPTAERETPTAERETPPSPDDPPAENSAGDDYEQNIHDERG